MHRTLAGDPRQAHCVSGSGACRRRLIYCVLATFGTVALLDRFPAVRTGIQALGILLFLAVGVWLLVARATPVVGHR